MRSVQRMTCTVLSLGILTALTMTSSLASATGDQGGAVRAYSSANSPNPFGFYDFAYGQYKAECVSGGPGVGLSASTSGDLPLELLCKTPLSGGTTPVLFDQSTSGTPYSDETTETFSTGDSADVESHGNHSDWDYGYFKGECPALSILVGIAQTLDSSHQINTIHCSGTANMCFQYGSAYVPTGSCHAVSLPSGGNPYYGTWGSGNQVSCGYQELMVGVSVDGNHHPRAILCCAGQWATC